MIENMNTLEAYETLKKVQFTDEQSREIVRLVARVHETEPASRKDLMESESNVRMEMKNTELRLQKEIEDIRLEIKNTELKLSKEIKELDTKLSVKLEKIHSDFIRWLIGAMIAAGGLLFTALRFTH